MQAYLEFTTASKMAAAFFVFAVAISNGIDASAVDDGGDSLSATLR